MNTYLTKVRDAYEYLVGNIFVGCCNTATDSILWYADEASFPATGIVETLYVDMATPALFLWDGAAYVQIGGGGSFVPYTGATGDVDLGTHGITSDFFQADLTPTNALQVGRMRWNDTDGTMDLRLKGNNVTLQIGQEQVARVVNKTVPLIDLLESAYQVVRITGATGQRLFVRLAQGNNSANSDGTLGIVTEDIAQNQEGFITVLGTIRSINTTGSLQGETWADGDTLFLSPTTAGSITNIQPVAPNHSVVVGYVEHAHAVNGKIFVKVDNGYELGQLHNVKLTSPQNLQGLFYNSATSLWENQNTPNVDLSSISVTETTARLDNWSPTGWTNTAASVIKVIKLNANYVDKVQVISGLTDGTSGRIVTITNTSTDNLVILELNSTNSSAANRFKFLGRGAYFLFPNDDITLLHNGVQWSQLSGNTKNGHTLFDDMGGPNNLSSNIFTSYFGETGYAFASGTGALVRNESAMGNSIGTIGLTTGTLATGFARITMNGRGGTGFGTGTTQYNQFAVVTRIRLEALPTALQDFRFQTGLNASANSLSPSITGMMGWYCTSANANWKCYAANTASTIVSDVTSGLAVTLNTDIVLATYHPNPQGDTVFVYSSDGGMTYTVDSKFVRVTSNYGGAPLVAILKTVGINSVTADIDYIGLTIKGARI
jgi:hypothetical protein